MDSRGLVVVRFSFGLILVQEKWEPRVFEFSVKLINSVFTLVISAQREDFGGKAELDAGGFGDEHVERSFDADACD